MGSDDLFKKRKENSLQKRSRGRLGKVRERILILSEGECTEKNYFESFHLTNVVVKGLGFNTDSLISEAIKRKKEAKKEGTPYDQVWCVADRDSFSTANVARAFDLARSNGIRIAWSNEAFEFWFLFHFNYYDSAFSRTQYKRKLTELLKREYCKEDPNHYQYILDKQVVALANAKRLYESYASFHPIDCNPITTVDQLVLELNQWKIKA